MHCRFPKGEDRERPGDSEETATAPGQTMAMERATEEVSGGTVRPRDSSPLPRALGFILEPPHNEKITLTGLD